MTTRKRLLALFVLLLLACRLPYSIGRRLSTQDETAPTSTAAPVSIYPPAGTAAIPGVYPGEPAGTLPAAVVPGYPGPGDAGPEYPGGAPQQTEAGIPGGYPGIEDTQAASTTGAGGQLAAGSATPGELEGDQTAAATIQPPTLIPSATPFLTPTPTLTHTPTITPSPLPPPAWSRANLRATDPRTVKLASGKVQLVEFFTFWSGPSQAMAPLVHGVESEYGERVNFVYLDIDDPNVESFKKELGFERAPHFFLLAPNGVIINEWVGYVTLAELRAALEAALNP